MNVLSLFDGISCCQLALERAGILVDNYYASEIDEYCLEIVRLRYPKTKQLGDVKRVSRDRIHIPRIDLITAGSPCQGFSLSGKQLNFDDPRSVLFFEFTRLIEELKPQFFFFENVMMRSDIEDAISEYLGVSPFLINSSRLSAQNRQRLYWTNIPDVTIPESLGITFGSIKEHNPLNKYYLSDEAKAFIKRTSTENNRPVINLTDFMKVPAITASFRKKYGNQNLIVTEDIKGLRCLTPLECERAQTIPDHYTNCVSDLQQYKMIGNAWTVDVIAHLFKGLNNAVWRF